MSAIRKIAVPVAPLFLTAGIATGECDWTAAAPGRVAN